MTGDRLPVEAISEGRTTYRPKNKRRILCIFPTYAPSFGTFEHAYKLFPDVAAFMPPQGLLLIAAYLPDEWEIRFVDENITPAADADIAWADVILISGMHVQRPAIHAINERAHRHGKLTVLGGPSVSASPEYYQSVDILHVGEIGDATDSLIAYIDAWPVRPPKQLVFETGSRLTLNRFPSPAYDLINVANYFLGSIQFSSGCPYRCEFCDIPALYGRNPRLKTPDQVCRELDSLLARGANRAVYFVDDNFIGNKKAVHDLLPHLIRWQEANDHCLRFACEATLNIAQMPALLEMMQEAQFHTVFVGIESPQEDALIAMQKKQNLRMPILEAVDTLNSHGMEVVSGIIMGLDTDTPQTGQHILSFIEASNIPLLTINLLYALPKTPLYDRLRRDGRLLAEDAAKQRVSNVDFAMPYEQVIQMWFDTISTAYAPENIFRRFRYQTERTFPNRKGIQSKPSTSLIWYGMQVLGRVLWHSGIRAEWRQHFWNLCWPLLSRGRVEEVVHIGVVTHHLITFTREIQDGKGEACFYADPNKLALPVEAR